MVNVNSASDLPKFQFKLVSPTRVRREALKYARDKRAHPFRRVSENFLIAVEVAALKEMYDRIKRHHSKGKTLL
jgi:hypothetical protein